MGIARAFCYAALIVSATPASGQDSDIWVTGNGLLRTCESTDRNAMVACAAYIEGVAAGINIGSVGAGKQHFCMPRGVTVQQTRDVVVKELRKNPETRHIISTALIGGILRTAYPCRRK